MKDLLENKSLIVFDGECLLCNNYIILVCKNDFRNQFKFISSQNLKLLKNIIPSDIELNQETIVLVENNFVVKIKSTAVISILSKLKFPYNLAIVFRFIPKKILNYFYDFLAKRRYNFFGKIDHCSILRAKEIDNFKDKIIE